MVFFETAGVSHSWLGFATTTKDLALRDVMSRAWTIVICEDCGVGPNMDHTYLHLDYLLPETFVKCWPDSSETGKSPFCRRGRYQGASPSGADNALQHGCTTTNGKIQVACIAVNTIVPGSLAAGEADGASVHGVILFGANLLLDFVVVGR